VPGKHRSASSGPQFSPEAAPVESHSAHAPAGFAARSGTHRVSPTAADAERPGRFRPTRLVPVVAAFGALLIILLAGVSMFGIPGTGSGGPTSVADRSLADRGSRDLERAGASASPTASASTTPSPTATSAAPKPSATTPKVVSTGTCEASYYGDGQNTASGEPFDPTALTAAHKTLPFNTKVRVTNLKNGRSVVVRINDRGPFVAGRCLDLSTAAFKQIASLSSGVAQVRYEVLK
jgi:rare lipoprotein A